MSIVVRPVTASDADLGSSVYVTGSMSAKTGRPPASTTEEAVAMKLNAGTTTSSPGPSPQARSSSTSASVPLLTATQWRAPVHSASAASQFPTCCPCEYLPSSITSVTRARMSGQASSNEAA